MLQKYFLSIFCMDLLSFYLFFLTAFAENLWYLLSESSFSEESYELLSPSERESSKLELLPLVLYFLFYESFCFILLPVTLLSFSFSLLLLPLSLASGRLLVVRPLDSRYLLLKVWWSAGIPDDISSSWVTWDSFNITAIWNQLILLSWYKRLK